MGVTTLKLIGIAPTDIRTAIGNNFSSGNPGVQGFEASNLTIDCNFSNNSSAYGTAGIAMHGKHIYLHRIRVINFGAASGFTIAAVNAASTNSENCVIEECVVESPSTHVLNVGAAYFYYFGGLTAQPHRFCVIRNCAGRGAAVFEPPPQINGQYYGIAPGRDRHHH